MSARHKLFRNAAILTVAGFISRIFGFLFRIFLPTQDCVRRNRGNFKVFLRDASVVTVPSRGFDARLARPVPVDGPRKPSRPSPAPLSKVRLVTSEP